MSIIKIKDIAYVRFSAPDLDVMQAFLEDFGLMKVESDMPGLYMAGIGGDSFLHATEVGEPAFKAIGFQAHSVDDLQTLAAANGVAVEPIMEPGGGQIVRLVDPDGNGVEIVAGRAAGPKPDGRHVPINTAWRKDRLKSTVRMDQGPSEVVRLGHAVLEVGNFAASEKWYKDNFGFLTTDQIEPAPGMALGAFMRCDLGDTPTDHHTLVVAQGMEGPKFNHAAFEVTDVNEVMKGHQHLKMAGHHSAWGVGRHILGSQIFDYWRDPWGFQLEHWTDGDLYTADMPPSVVGMAELMGVQWGNPDRTEARFERTQS